MLIPGGCFLWEGCHVNPFGAWHEPHGSELWIGLAQLFLAMEGIKPLCVMKLVGAEAPQYSLLLWVMVRYRYLPAKVYAWAVQRAFSNTSTCSSWVHWRYRQYSPVTRTVRGTECPGVSH